MVLASAKVRINEQSAKENRIFLSFVYKRHDMHRLASSAHKRKRAAPDSVPWVALSLVGDSDGEAKSRRAPARHPLLRRTRHHRFLDVVSAAASWSATAWVPHGSAYL